MSKMFKWKFTYSLENMPTGYTEASGENLSEEEALQIALEDGQHALVVDVEKIED